MLRELGRDRATATVIRPVLGSGARGKLLAGSGRWTAVGPSELEGVTTGGVTRVFAERASASPATSRVASISNRGRSSAAASRIRFSAIVRGMSSKSGLSIIILIANQPEVVIGFAAGVVTRSL